MAKKIASLYAEIGADTTKLKAGLDETKGQLTQAKTKFDNLKASVLPAIGIVAGFGAALKGAYDIAKEGAAMEFAVGKFDRLAESAGTTADVLLNDLKKATRGTVSDMQLMASAGDFMALGLAKSRDEIVRLTRVAGALGMDMNQLVLTLTNQTTMRFDALGVSVDGFDEKVKKLKDSGMDANAAFKEAFLQQAEAQIGKVGDKADTAAGQIAVLEANFANLGNSAKGALVEPLNNIAIALNKILFGAKEVNEVLTTHEGDVRTSAKSWEEYIKELARAGVVAGKFNQEMADQAVELALNKGEIWELKAIYGDAGVKIDVASEAVYNWAQAAANGTLAAADMTEMLYGARDASDAATESVIKYDDATGKLADNTGLADSAMQSYTKSLLFNLAAQGLDADAALNLAYRMGLVDESTVLATEKTEAYRQMLKDGAIDLETYNALVAGLADSLDRLEDKTITVTYNQVTTGTTPNGDWQATGGEGTTTTAKAAGGPVYPGMTISDWRTTSGANEVLIQQPGYVLTEQEAMDALAGARGGGGINITVYGAADPNQTANLVNMNLKAAFALNGA